MELSLELEANLRELASAGPVELRENGARVAPTARVFQRGPRPGRKAAAASLVGPSQPHAPRSRHHGSTDTLARSLSPQLDMVRVGLAENWRRGLRTILRR